MEKNVSGLLIMLSVLFAAILVVGGTVVYNAGQDSIDVPIVQDCPEVEIPEAEVIIEQVANASLYLTDAVDDFMDYIDDEELYECNDYEYDFDEIFVNKIYNSYTVSIDDDEYSVGFKVKLEFDDDDERACKKTFNVVAEYEDDEETEFIIA